MPYPRNTALRVALAAVFGLATALGSLWFVYHFVEAISSIKDAEIVTTIVAVLAIPLLAVGLYFTIHVKTANTFRESMTRWVGTLGDGRSRFWLIFLLPLLFPTFVVIFDYSMALLITLLSIPFGGLNAIAAKVVSLGVMALALVASTLTCRWLWVNAAIPTKEQQTK